MAARVVFVTGKGGTGKSSVATALAREIAARGQRVLLLRMPAASESAAAGAPPASVASLHERTLDARADLEAFLARVLGLAFVARRLGESRTFSAVAAAAPGLRDLVALSAIADAAARRRGFVVVDAPATGHSVPMLTAPARVLELAPIGPVAREATRAKAMIADRGAFVALLVTTPEELAINEVLSLRDQVEAAGVAAARVVVNALWPARASAEDGERIAASGASTDATMHWRRHVRQAALVRALEQRLGACSSLGFAFDDEGPPRADVAVLLDSLSGAAA